MPVVRHHTFVDGQLHTENTELPKAFLSKILRYIQCSINYIIRKGPFCLIKEGICILPQAIR
ncbi:hypothetical protein T4B_6721 [Trichinella pseudospiralis]|uniref:Uncharacterized protein n=1 Tax=Trichinella pseudospiralis TaxID=6337 RepID=A0A0V1GSE9_TRIPS|nr:hypothetical protein T4B_6721 [Trichinella pseudospiralis]